MDRHRTSGQCVAKVWAAAEIIGVTDRTMRRWRERLEEYGYSGLADRKEGKPSGKRIPLATEERVLQRYREKYYDLNIRHFHEKLREEHQIQLSYTWVQTALQDAGFVAKRRKRSPHRRRRPRRPMPGMPLPSTAVRTVTAGLREVIETQGLFCALYSDRASHFFLTVKQDEKVDKHRLTQGGRAAKELGVQMIAAYSPQARGADRNEASELSKGGFPRLRLAGISEVAEANRFFKSRTWRSSTASSVCRRQRKGTALRRAGRTDLNLIFSITAAPGNFWPSLPTTRLELASSAPFQRPSTTGVHPPPSITGPLDQADNSRVNWTGRVTY